MTKTVGPRPPEVLPDGSLVVWAPDYDGPLMRRCWYCGKSVERHWPGCPWEALCRLADEADEFLERWEAR